MEQTITRPQIAFDLETLRLRLAEDKDTYEGGQPFKHIVIEDFLESDLAEKIWEQFPKVGEDGWTHYVHFNEKKHGCNKIDLLPSTVQKVIRDLNSPDFAQYLSELTGIDDLLPDHSLEGGGIHQTLRGGFLNLHTDFSVHPHKRKWKRRVNVLLYFNKDWQASYGGDLEFWSRDMKKCGQKIAPLLNRAVIFNTNEFSFHGSPEPLNCPEGESRKSIALYYYTVEDKEPQFRSTDYRSRPGDGMKSIFIFIDKKLISLYTRIKSAWNINDDFISGILNKFGRK